jgi:sulfane dehydrogenase subunit SoxC
VNDAPTLILDDKAQRMIDEMIDAEACHLAQRRAREECACKEGMFPGRAPTDRRAFLLAAGSTAGAAAVLGRYTSWSMTPLDKMIGNLTASGLHFERHHGGIPTIDPSRHTLVVHDMVGTAKKFSMTDLKRFPSVIRKYFIECSATA